MEDIKEPARKRSEPIRLQKDVAALKELLKGDRRNHAIFILGINTAIRPSGIVSLRVGDVRHLHVGDRFEWGGRGMLLNRPVHDALYLYLEYLKNKNGRIRDEDPLFLSRNGRRRPLAAKSIWNLVRDWCSQAGLKGYYGAHTLRKTFGYHQRTYQGTSLSELQRIFGHRCGSETREYLGLPEEKDVSRILPGV
jgi:integrase